MNYGPLVFLAAFLVMSSSWFGFVMTSHVQIGREQQGTNTIVNTELYPIARPGMAAQGLQVYRANGCAACHSQSVKQTGRVAEVWLREAGTNLTTVAAVLEKALTEKFNAAGLAGGLPKRILQSDAIETAVALTKALNEAGAKSETRVVPIGPDIPLWGVRGSVARDYLYDNPVMLGSLRAGPDLANVGMRKPDMNWELLHLYAPKSQVQDSTMPSYKFLFEMRKIASKPSPDALPLAGTFAPPAGYEVVPKPEAKQLAAYLVSLQSATPLAEAPLTVAVAPASTNAPAK